MKKVIIGCMITEQEHERLRELKELFGTKTQSDVIKTALNYVQENQNIEVTVPTRDKNSKWEKVSLSLWDRTVQEIEDYALANFRDFANTIRFLINASYESITNNKK